MARGRIPLDEALGIARQIAEALEEAHEHGIVHRDLKPANVKLTAEGKGQSTLGGASEVTPRSGPFAGLYYTVLLSESVPTRSGGSRPAW